MLSEAIPYSISERDIRGKRHERLTGAR
jgi:hypothetical protein